MARFDKEFVLKHHFWVMLPLALVFVLIACALLWSDVPDTIDARQKDAQQKIDGLTSYADHKPQPSQMIGNLKNVTGLLDKEKTNLWKEAWDQQKDAKIFAWPAGLAWPSMAGFDEHTLMLKDKPFGADLSDKAYNQVRDKFSRPAYWQEYQALADTMPPIQFRVPPDTTTTVPGWVLVLKPVGTESGWGDLNAYSEEMWLAIEDIWLKRHVLRAIRRINEKAAVLNRSGDVAEHTEGPNGVFGNKVWDLRLWVDDPKGSRTLRGKLVNKTPFLQPMSANNEMKFLIWFTPQRADERPEDFRRRAFEFIVQGTGVPGMSKDGKTPLNEKTKLPVNEYPIEVLNTPGKSHAIPMGQYGDKIVRVEQVFDSRTTPVKWVDEIALPMLGDRQAGVPLKMAAFSDKVAEEEGKKGPALSATTISSGPVAAPTTDALAPADAPAPQPTKPVMTVHQIFRTRYIEANEQIRRIPVKVRLTVEQGYSMNILSEIVDSKETKIPFQITQTEMNRVVDDTIPTVPQWASADPSSPLDVNVPDSATDENEGYDEFQKILVSRQNMSSGPRPVGPVYFGSGAGVTQVGQSGTLGAPSLMEVTIWGIVSFYENYDFANKKAPETPTAKHPPGKPAPKPPGKNSALRRDKRLARPRNP